MILFAKHINMRIYYRTTHAFANEPVDQIIGSAHQTTSRMVWGSGLVGRAGIILDRAGPGRDI